MELVREALDNALHEILLSNVVFALHYLLHHSGKHHSLHNIHMQLQRKDSSCMQDTSVGRVRWERRGWGHKGEGGGALGGRDAACLQPCHNQFMKRKGPKLLRLYAIVAMTVVVFAFCLHSDCTLCGLHGETCTSRSRFAATSHAGGCYDNQQMLSYCKITTFLSCIG